MGKENERKKGIGMEWTKWDRKWMATVQIGPSIWKNLIGGIFTFNGCTAPPKILIQFVVFLKIFDSFGETFSLHMSLAHRLLAHFSLFPSLYVPPHPVHHILAPQISPLAFLVHRASP